MPAPQGYVALDLVGFTDKGDYAAGTTYAQNDLVHSDNRIYLSLQDNNVGQALPVSPATETAFWKLWLSGGGDDLEALTAEDTSNVIGGGAGQVVVAQTLIDAIANKVMNDLVAKSQIINNLLATQAGNVLDATQGKALKDEIDQLNSDLNSRIAVSDLNTAVDVSPHAPLIVQCDANTLNTPYKAGLTSSASGTAYITGGSDSNYLTMFYVPASDPNMFIRSRASGTWHDWGHIITNADFAPLTYNDTPGDNIQDLIKAKAKIIAQNMSGNVCGMLPGGWQGEQFGFTLFGRSNNIITLMIVLQWATYTAYYDTSTDTVSSINKITMTSVS